MPEIFSTRNYLKAVNHRDVDICRRQCVFRSGPTCDPEVFELLMMYMAENMFEPPTSAQEAVALYHELRPIVLYDLLVDV